LKQPLVCMKSFDLRTLLISAEPKLPDKSEFWLHYMQTVFNKYTFPQRLNRLGAKSFYDAIFKIDRLTINVQGFDTIYIIWDLGWFLEKFAYVDLCDTAPKNFKIDKKFSPLDNTRHQWHGKLAVKLKNTEMNIFQAWNFQRIHPKFKFWINNV